MYSLSVALPFFSISSSDSCGLAAAMKWRKKTENIIYTFQAYTWCIHSAVTLLNHQLALQEHLVLGRSHQTEFEEFKKEFPLKMLMQK